MRAMAWKESDRDWAARLLVATVLLWTSVYEFSDFFHQTRLVYQHLSCSTNKKAVGTVVDNLEQQVVMVLVHTVTADWLVLRGASISYLLEQYGHPDTLAVGSVVGVVRFCPRSHFRTVHVLESVTC